MCISPGMKTSRHPAHMTEGWEAQSHLLPWSSQSPSEGPGKSCLHASGEGERVIAPEPWEGTLASRRVEEGLSRSFPG